MPEIVHSASSSLSLGVTVNSMEALDAPTCAFDILILVSAVEPANRAHATRSAIVMTIRSFARTT